ncbi:MAG TPA: response regulator FixJ [Methylocystis sp.]|nr:response regulator FixJ [Methylocystis sp.]
MTSPRLVHVIEDDPGVLHSIELLLSAEGFEVKTYASAESFLEGIGSSLQGCVVTDVRMPGMSGVELLSKIKDRGLAAPVVVITGHGDIPLAVRAMKLGALDLLEKPFRPEDLISSIRQALSIRHAGREGDEALERQRRLATLSARESDVLKGLLKGLPNKIIAHELGISPRTVEIHRANVMKKTQAGSLAELVRMSLGVVEE